MSEIEIVQMISGMGVGGFLGTLIFVMYRKDRCSSEKRLMDERRLMEDRLSRFLEEDQKSREANTKALTELIVLISRLNGRLTS